LAYVALYLLGYALGWALLVEDTAVLVGKLTGLFPSSVVRAALIGVAAAGLPAAVLIGRALAGKKFRAVVVLSFAAVAIANHLVLVDDYPGVHALAAACAATLLSSGLARSEPLARPLGMARWVVVTALFALAGWTLVVPPSNAVAVELFRSSGTVVAPLLPRLKAEVPEIEASPSAPAASVTSSPPPAANVAPTGARLLPRDAIVLLLTVDCFRSDLLGEPHIKRLPTLAKLRSESVVFSRARSVAPSTIASIASLFSSRYASELLWTQDPDLHPAYYYPHRDPTPRFPELLTAVGIGTSNVQGLPGLKNETGLLRGFVREQVVESHRHKFAGAEELVPAILEDVRTKARGPLFLYAHFDDAHTPYDRGGRKGTPFERYLREIEIIDRELGTLIAELDKDGLWPRTVVVFSADHGEAFGEHGSQTHAKTLYDEVLRVPLLVRVPGVAPRVVRERVSTIDIGPTVLDLFGVPVPGVYKGQTLVPFLLGNDTAMSRPLAFESSRYMRAMIFEDGSKVIEDRRKRTVELFDLDEDPGELTNLYDEAPPAAERLARMRRFFAAHELRRPGYRLPYAR
jgi:arylsulfatase A-like enzyme